MQTKLTLRLDDVLIQQAKDYAKQNGKSVSQIVTEFFTVLSAKQQDTSLAEISPITKKLLGCMSGAGLDEQDYKAHLLNKYK
jgi:hypothetical protein